MRHFLLGTLVALLTLSASGVTTVIAGEPCPAFDPAGHGEDDRRCPPTCVTCGCCAQGIDAVNIPVAGSPSIPAGASTAGLSSLPTVDPREILHVPRTPVR